MKRRIVILGATALIFISAVIGVSAEDTVKSGKQQQMRGQQRRPQGGQPEFARLRAEIQKARRAGDEEKVERLIKKAKRMHQSHAAPRGGKKQQGKKQQQMRGQRGRKQQCGKQRQMRRR